MFDKVKLQPYHDHAAACSDCSAVDAKQLGAERCIEGKLHLLDAMYMKQDVKLKKIGDNK